MSDTISGRLEALGVEIPDVAAPAANYLPYTKSGNLVFTSGQLPFVDGVLVHTGKVGGELSVEDGQDAARLCAINVLAVAKAALGDLQNIKKIVKITIFVSSTPDFTSQHLVGNGASDFLAEVLGDAGSHARSAVGMPCLPLNAPVEVEAIIEAK
ncbi:MAG: RidA family protein [Pseudomonadota bacterium]